MGESPKRKRFDGAAWFDRQVQRRTRAALTERGSKASTRSREYQTEYQRQRELFTAERKEVKRLRAEKRAEREARKAQRDGALRTQDL